MIAYLEGKIIFRDTSSLVIDVNGIGYEVKISLNTFSALKDVEKGRIFTYLSIKEDAHTLFGFKELKEKKAFLHLISVNGVGPGTALVVLSSLSVEDLYNAILKEDVRLIQSVKGIGGKTAQRIILELRDKVKKESFSPNEAISNSFNYNIGIREEALTALVTLGIAKPMADKIIDNILKVHGTEISLEDLIKNALKSLK
jgi:holliday junction DNA helicase RuvA